MPSAPFIAQNQPQSYHLNKSPIKPMENNMQYPPQQQQQNRPKYIQGHNPNDGYKKMHRGNEGYGSDKSDGYFKM
jgi:hypothetical protein